MAGRLHRGAKGRIEIDCNGEGAAFVEAEAEADLDDIGDFAPHPDFYLTPKVDYSQGISSFPLLLVQYLYEQYTRYVLMKTKERTSESEVLSNERKRIISGQ
ncbi:hypothetical protein SASPL_118024 [Salvia splendens]|uniref:Uncharacterized protein n=1 Tax=Salvia splendens TaxID=180675 RepID=A0A8X8Y1M2_SALSN|nr:hypothetical protein SASPL_118024 [Salvia splendens]